MKTIILLSGKMRVGKNKFAEYLIDELKQRQFKIQTDLFAHDLKHGCKDDFKTIATYMNGLSERIKATVHSMFDLKYIAAESIVNAVEHLTNELKVKDENFFEDKTEFTRLLLQIYGTEIFRNRVDTNWWAKQVRNRAIKSEDDFYIVTDTRFPNEIEVFYDECNMENTQVITIRLNRDAGTTGSKAEHQSETALDEWTEWNYVVQNDGSLDELKQSVTTIINDILDNQDV